MIETNKLKPIIDDDYHKMMMEVDNQMEEEKFKILNLVKNEISIELYDYIIEVIEDSGFTYDFQIVDTPVGDYQEEDKYWVNQTTNGGYLGDEFAGTLCFKISENKYLKFFYSM